MGKWETPILIVERKPVDEKDKDQNKETKENTESKENRYEDGKAEIT